MGELHTLLLEVEGGQRPSDCIVAAAATVKACRLHKERRCPRSDRPTLQLAAQLYERHLSDMAQKHPAHNK